MKAEYRSVVLSGFDPLRKLEFGCFFRLPRYRSVAARRRTYGQSFISNDSRLFFSELTCRILVMELYKDKKRE
jgi:hypothetical protein